MLNKTRQFLDLLSSLTTALSKQMHRGDLARRSFWVAKTFPPIITAIRQKADQGDGFACVNMIAGPFALPKLLFVHQPTDDGNSAENGLSGFGVRSARRCRSDSGFRCECSARCTTRPASASSPAKWKVGGDATGGNRAGLLAARHQPSAPHRKFDQQRGRASATPP